VADLAGAVGGGIQGGISCGCWQGAAVGAAAYGLGASAAQAIKQYFPYFIRFNLFDSSFFAKLPAQERAISTIVCLK
jgi:hypothetical protein